MGWDDAFKNVARLGTFCQGIKVDAVRKYIKEQILKGECSNRLKAGGFKS